MGNEMRANGQNSHLRDQQTNVNVPKAERYDMATLTAKHGRPTEVKEKSEATSFQPG